MPFILNVVEEQTLIQTHVKSPARKGKTNTILVPSPIYPQLKPSICKLFFSKLSCPHRKAFTIQLHTFASPAADRHLATSNPSLQLVVSFTKSVKTPISHHPHQCLGSGGKSGSLKAPNLLTLSLNDLLPAEI